MKSLFSLLFVLCGFVLQAQSSYQSENWYLNTGFSFGYYGYGFSGNRNIKILPTTASIERAISNQVGIGAYLGYAKWEYSGYYDLEFLSLGGRLSWHFLPILKKAADLDLNGQRWDVYLAGIFGYEMRMADEYSNSISPYGNESRFIAGPVLGVKYFFNPTIAFYVEGGKGAFGYGTAGIGFVL